MNCKLPEISADLATRLINLRQIRVRRTCDGSIEPSVRHFDARTVARISRMASSCSPGGRAVSQRRENMRVLAASAIALAAMMAWSYAMAEDVHILGFRFGCETPDGEKA